MGNVRTEELTKRYEDTTAVDGVDLEVEDGEFVTLVGPSGCGKSTTLEMIAGLTTPTSGTVSIAGRDVTKLPPKDREIAMVFQNIALFPHMDVHDNVSFGLRLRDFDGDEIDRRVEEALSIVQMDGMGDRMPDELSGGQRQRIAIARAIVREPEVFLMDEPLANLDAALRVHMRTELQRLHRELETTIVYVTHDQEEAMTMSNRLAVMNEGHVEQYADPMTCYAEPNTEFVAGFIGSPSMNFFDGEVTESGVETAYFDVPFDAEAFDVAPGQAVFVYLLLDPQGDGEAGEQEELLMSAPPGPELTDDVEGTSFRLRMDRAQIHLFDAETGEAILHGLSETPPSEPGMEEVETDGGGRTRDDPTG